MKKTYVALKRVRDFIDQQPEGTRYEYQKIVDQLIKEGFLIEPYGKKLEKDLFEIRVRHENNIRVFYFYHEFDIVYAVHGFIKKTFHTPHHEMRKARKIIKQIKGGIYAE